MTIVTVTNQAQLANFERPVAMIAAAGDNPFAENPDAHFIATDDQGHCAACCSIWYRSTPPLDGESIGYIGHYFATEADTSDTLLAAAIAELTRNGCAIAVGPMNGNTWRKYRFVTWSNGEPPILLEPVNPPEWPGFWAGFGFEPLATYHSSIIDDLSRRDERIERAELRLAQNGVTIRPLDLDRYSDELRRIYRVSAESFVSNFLYTPIDEPTFLSLYEPVKRFADPRFCLIADVGDEPVGFIFSLPDLSQQARGQKVDTLIIKTLAVLPKRQNAGLGAALVERMRQPALDAGMRRIVHALMHDQNNSANIGRDRSRALRRYTLFAKRLAS